jgi:hypothetical protein
MCKCNDQTISGRMLPAMTYSGKTIVTNKGFHNRQILEIARVKALPVGGHAWVVCNRKNSLYRDDTIVAINGIGEKTYLNVFKPINIYTVGNLLDNKDNRQELSCTTGLLLVKINKYIDDAVERCTNDDPLPVPPVTDHRKADNPYQSKHGDDWEKEIRKGNLVRDFVNIHEVVEHIYTHTRHLFNPTADPTKDDWFFYHDALSLMVCDETKQWMQTKGYLKHWILPACGLQHGDLKEYDGRPVGNSPEMQPLDNNLNKDMHDGVQYHCAATAHLPDDDSDPRKFSLSTPQRGDHAYFRVLDGVPTSERIVQDCTRWEENLWAIFRAKGALVPGIGNREGRRRDQAPIKRGGRRVRNPDDGWVQRWMHPDALSAQDDFAAMTIEQYSERMDEVMEVEEEAIENAGESEADSCE